MMTSPANPPFVPFHSKHRHAFRATHVKTLGVVKGTLTIKDDLPQHLAQGLFAHPGRKYDLAMRYAVEPSEFDNG